MVNSSTFISDTVLFIRDDLGNNITDPIAASRVASERFVMTSYPKRAVKYPIITVKATSIVTARALGMRSELQYMELPVEVRIWARAETERDNLTEQVINRLRTNQFGGGSASSDDESLLDFAITNSTSIDEDGEEGIKSRILTVLYKFVLGAT